MPPQSPASDAAATPPADMGLIHAITHNSEAWLWGLGWIVIAAVAGWVVYRIVYAVIRSVLRRRPWGRFCDGEAIELDVLVLSPVRGSLRWMFPLLAIKLFALDAAVGAGVPAPSIAVVSHVIDIALIAAVTMLVLGVLTAGANLLNAKHRVDVADNLEARRMRTQVQVMRQVLAVLVIVVGIAAALMTFDGVRQFGASLLASAGIAALVLGLAARPLLENIIAGIQVALAQPIRMDDVVTIDGYYGRITEIATTYVVVTVWDERQLVVPFSRLLTKPFENWTRNSANITGTVSVQADYTASVDDARKAVKKMVEKHAKWDKRSWGLQVTDSDGRTMTLRALVSASNASDLWDLKCDLREGLIAYLQREQTDHLPRERNEIIEQEQPG